MKITPPELIESWNALGQLMQVNEGSKFQAQALRLQMQLRDEVAYWNSLSMDQRQAIAGEPLVVQVQPITAAPEVYANDQITALNRLLAEPLAKKESKMEQLMKSKQKDEPKTEEE